MPLWWKGFVDIVVKAEALNQSKSNTVKYITHCRNHYYEGRLDWLRFCHLYTIKYPGGLIEDSTILVHYCVTSINHIASLIVHFQYFTLEKPG